MSRRPTTLICADVSWAAIRSEIQHKYDPELAQHIRGKDAIQTLESMADKINEMKQVIKDKTKDELDDSGAGPQIGEAFYMLLHAEKMLNYSAGDV